LFFVAGWRVVVTARQQPLYVSLSRRWLVEKRFGWLKQTGPLRQVKLRGLQKVDWLFARTASNPRKRWSNR
jgi:hypothetical protein